MPPLFVSFSILYTAFFFQDYNRKLDNLFKYGCHEKTGYVEFDCIQPWRGQLGDPLAPGGLKYTVILQDRFQRPGGWAYDYKTQFQAPKPAFQAPALPTK